MTFKTGLSILAIAVTLLEPTAAFWRLPCRAQSAVARIDPIVDKGKISSHLHNIFGGSNFNFDSDYGAMMDSECTSCQVKQDKSAYWTPSLMFEYEDGTTVPVEPVGGMLVYYLLFGENIQPFPEGFQVLAGDPKLRDFPWKANPDKNTWSGDELSQLALSQKAIGFNCLNYGGPAEPTLFRHFLPDKKFIDENCPDGIRVEVMFPSCWNGKDVTASDHKAHMAYPDHVMDGKCPEGFEVPVPAMLYEIIYETYAFKEVNGGNLQKRGTPPTDSKKSQSGRFVLSNGDPTGYGMHGDFLAAWDNDVLARAIKTCTNPSGVIDDCPVFDLEKDDSVVEKCKVRLPKECEEEQCHKPRKGLCGDVVISDNAADYAEVVHNEAEDMGIDMSSSPGDENIQAKGFAQPDGKPDGLFKGDAYSEADNEPIAEPIEEPIEEPVFDADAEGADDYGVPAPMITPYMEAQFAVDNEDDSEGAVRTITTTSDGIAYEVVVYEVFTTITEDRKVAAAEPSPDSHYKAKRHMHHHQQRHLHKHL